MKNDYGVFVLQQARLPPLKGGKWVLVAEASASPRAIPHLGAARLMPHRSAAVGTEWEKVRCGRASAFLFLA